MMSESLGAGAVIDQRYEVLRVLGQGAFATTYLARDLLTHIRIRSPRLATSGRVEASWAREVGKVGSKVRNKNCIRRD
jgi:serine/threonine protein kinase